jgi:DNA adenine methylase
MSAFGYFGSKLRIAAKLGSQLPPHSAWVELFCGSAAMTLAKQPAPIEVINDLNGEIVNFFRQLRNNGARLRKAISLTPYAREEFAIARGDEDGLSDLERARRFFVAAMMAINGSFGDDPGGFSISNSYSRNGREARVNRWNETPGYLDTVATRLKRVRIENQDALKLFADFKKRPGTLCYFDPPYLGKRQRGYDLDQNNLEFHEKLLGEVITADCMVFISGYQHELYDLYLTPKRGWSKETIAATTKGNNGKSFQRVEVIWFNESYSLARDRGRLPLRLSKEESKNNKVNPKRLFSRRKLLPMPNKEA